MCVYICMHIFECPSKATQPTRTTHTHKLNGLLLCILSMPVWEPDFAVEAERVALHRKPDQYGLRSVDMDGYGSSGGRIKPTHLIAFSMKPFNWLRVDTSTFDVDPELIMYLEHQVQANDMYNLFSIIIIIYSNIRYSTLTYSLRNQLLV